MIKNKVINICSKSYPDLKTSLESFHIKNLANLCLDSVFLIFYFEKLGIKDSSYLIMRAHAINKKIQKDENIKINYHIDIKIFIKYLTNEKNVYITSIFISCILILLVFKNFKSYIKKITISCMVSFENMIDSMKEKDEIYYKSYLEYYKVKYHLLHKEDSLIKEKYGKNFDPETISEKDLIKEFLYFMKDSEQLKKILLEIKLSIADIKFAMIESIIIILLNFCIFVTYIFISYKISSKFGILSLLFINMLFLIKIIFVYIIKKTYCFYFNKIELGKILKY